MVVLERLGLCIELVQCDNFLKFFSCDGFIRVNPYSVGSEQVIGGVLVLKLVLQTLVGVD